MGLARMLGACLAGACLAGLLAGCAQAPTAVQGEGTGFPAATAAGAYEKRWTAIEAARQRALADLAEKVQGVRLARESSVRDLALVDERVEGRVAGTLVGVELVRATYDPDAEVAAVALRVTLKDRERGAAAGSPEPEP